MPWMNEEICFLMVVLNLGKVHDNFHLEPQTFPLFLSFENLVRYSEGLWYFLFSVQFILSRSFIDTILFGNIKRI